MGRTLEEAVTEALEGGLKALQLREKELETRGLLDLALRLRALTAAHGARLFINDRVDVALAAQADGVHLATTSMPVEAVRRVAGHRLMIGVSTHNMDEALRAESGGADFITFGPVFDTPSKKPFGPPVGQGALKAVAGALSIPVFALGGVRLDRVRGLRGQGAAGVALITDILAAPNITERTRAFLRELE